MTSLFITLLFLAIKIFNDVEWLTNYLNYLNYSFPETTTVIKIEYYHLIQRHLLLVNKEFLGGDFKYLSIIERK